MKSSHQLAIMFLLFVFLSSACRQKSPEKLPKFKDKFRASIANFESQKKKTDSRVEDGVKRLSTIQDALANAKNVDKEFERVYGQWGKVDRQVNRLNKDYENLKEDANNLFNAMQKQTESLNDQKTKSELMSALNKTRSSYDETLAKTSSAIEKLRALHDEAKDVIKALEVAVGLGQIAEISSGLKSIEDRVGTIMAELNNTISESKDLYDKKINAF